MVTSNYNRLIVNSGIEDCEGNEMIFLFKDKEVSEIAYNDGSYSTLYMLGDLYVERADDEVYKEDFDNNLYYEADETDKKENIVMLDNLYEYESKPYVKADWSNHDHYLRLASEHGINVSVYDFKDDVEILKVNVIWLQAILVRITHILSIKTFSSSWPIMVRNTI